MSAFRRVLEAARRPGVCRGQLREVGAALVALATLPLGTSVGPLDLALATAKPAADVVPLDTPVVLVHGFAGSKSNFLVVESSLRRAGYRNIVRFGYDALTHDVPEVAQSLSDCVTRLLACTGAERVHLVGHSLGGVIGRYFVTELGGEAVVDVLLTVASPHGGSPVARLGALRPVETGGCLLQIAPGSSLLSQLDESLDRRCAAGRRVQCRWVCYFSDIDLVVPGASAQVHHRAVDVQNVPLPNLGHLSVLVSRRLAAGVTAELLAQDARAQRLAAPQEQVAA